MKTLTIYWSLFAIYSIGNAVPVSLTKRATAEDWKDRTIYQLLTDRFATTDNSNASCQDLTKYCGGTFQGITNQLDYIQGMGFDAIWISPIPENVDNGYHGYHAKDFEKINSHFGTSDELTALVNEAHKRNMYVMLDVVANHQGAPSSKGDYSGFTFNSPDLYHKECTIDYNNQNSIEVCWLSGLPDIDTENTANVQKLNSIVNGWVSTYNFDGIRIDTLKHVRKDFWPGYIKSSNVFATGEVFDGNPQYVAGYLESTNSLINYPLYYGIINVFTKKNDISTLYSTWQTLQTATGNKTSYFTNFCDNHDVRRIATLTNGDYSLVKNAVTFTLMIEGIPTYYYGTEQGLLGSDDPDNRKPLWANGGFDTTSDMYQFTKTLVKNGRQANNGSVLMNAGTCSNSCYGFIRGKALVIVNNLGSGSQETITFKSSQLEEGKTMKDIFSGIQVTVTNGSINFQLSNGLPVIFV
ncbi:a-amylase [Cunninghamella echinulata]|nr:a-amylase [Cunninghamella echinulata]